MTPSWVCGLCGARFEDVTAADRHARTQHADVPTGEALNAIGREEARVGGTAAMSPNVYFGMGVPFALLIPFVGLVLGGVWMARGHMGKGFALIGLGLLCLIAWAVVLGLAPPLGG